MHALLAADVSNPSEITVKHLDYNQTIGDIVIKKSDIKHYYNYINTLVKSEQHLPSEKIHIKNWATIENLKIMMDLLLDSPSNKEIMMRIKAVMSSFVSMVDKTSTGYRISCQRGSITTFSTFIPSMLP